MAIPLVVVHQMTDGRSADNDLLALSLQELKVSIN
jgi:hypothetical protein